MKGTRHLCKVSLGTCQADLPPHLPFAQKWSHSLILGPNTGHTHTDQNVDIHIHTDHQKSVHTMQMGWYNPLHPHTYTNCQNLTN